jgi:hypothetical protein
MAVTDDFDRADSATLGANWTELDSGVGIANNRALGTQTSYTYQWAVYSGISWNDDHTSQCVVGAASGTTFDDGPIVRAASVGGTDGYYAMYHGGGLRRLYRRDNGGFSLLQNMDAAVSSGQTIKLEATGSTLKYFVAGGQIGTDQGDGTYATGRPGICLSSAGGWQASPGAGYDYVDDWEGTGEVTARRFILGTH